MTNLPTTRAAAWQWYADVQAANALLCLGKDARLAVVARVGSTHSHLTTCSKARSIMAAETVTPEVVSRKEAKARGLKFYFTGEACKRGHVANRYVSTFSCVVCRTMEPKDPVTRAAYRAKYKADGRAAVWSKKWYFANKDDNKEKRNKWSRDWNAKNRERCKLNLRAWATANKGKARALDAKRRAREMGAEGSYTEAEVAKLFQGQSGKCAYCRKKLRRGGYHRDHIIPLSKGGTNWIRNIQLTCQRCNNQKYAKDPIEFARQLGRLL